MKQKLQSQVLMLKLGSLKIFLFKEIWNEGGLCIAFGECWPVWL